VWVIRRLEKVPKVVHSGKMAKSVIHSDEMVRKRGKLRFGEMALTT